MQINKSSNGDLSLEIGIDDILNEPEDDDEEGNEPGEGRDEQSRMERELSNLLSLPKVQQKAGKAL